MAGIGFAGVIGGEMALLASSCGHAHAACAADVTDTFSVQGASCRGTAFFARNGRPRLGIAFVDNQWIPAAAAVSRGCSGTAIGGYILILGCQATLWGQLCGKRDRETINYSPVTHVIFRINRIDVLSKTGKLHNDKLTLHHPMQLMATH